MQNISTNYTYVISGVTGERQSAPPPLSTEKLLVINRDNGARKNGKNMENEEEMMKNGKGKEENEEK